MSSDRPLYYRFEHHPHPVRLFPPEPQKRPEPKLSEPKQRYLTDEQVAQVRRELREEFGDAYPDDRQAANAVAPAPPPPARAALPELPPEARPDLPPEEPSRKSSPEPIAPAPFEPAGLCPGDPATAEQIVRAERWHWRHACNWLELFRLCGQTRCRHASRCRGEPVRCLHAGVPHVPQSARLFVERMMKAKELGLSFEEAFDDVAEHHDGYFAWLAGLRAVAPSQAPAPPPTAARRRGA